ncbi:MAG TPA: hypothetical protein VJC10_03630 [Patescibacteria group bacterium]|nr:hypothetical protein [Patescibacteria group bacterium]
MKAERLILSFIAILIGLLVAGVAFYFYQSTKKLKNADTKTITIKINPSPTPDTSLFLTIDSPKDEAVFSRKTITISGKTKPDATILISTELSDEVVKPARNGNFSTTLSIGDEASIIEITAFFANGEQKTIRRTVSFTTEEF